MDQNHRIREENRPSPGVHRTNQPWVPPQTESENLGENKKAGGRASPGEGWSEAPEARCGGAPGFFTFSPRFSDFLFCDCIFSPKISDFSDSLIL